ncbi:MULTISPECIES: sodium/glutamate symporter [unclassified Agarivorans]|uniref:sodium/glutamate symporter n=1 Tax=unclassified Agarivorans TaxID=2636026 RepID=UPI0010F5F370|nr:MULTISPECIES: sodium/glutamate symporter [unclassified Agarivorans]MDO6765727.1 sodium/glutamate symporter [Agarivorans sp. 1_MG-2023]
MDTVYAIAELESFLIALTVLFIGRIICNYVAILKKYNIPEPIVGGLVVAIVITLLKFRGIELTFALPLQDTLMLMFFSTVGLAANYKLLVKGGKKVFVFLGIASLYIVLQNGLGVMLASALGLEPMMGLFAGSITLSGGHGTGAAWSQIFAEEYNIQTLEFAMAAATFGLVMGGIIGGPVGQRLINKHNLESPFSKGKDHHKKHPDIVTYSRKEEDLVTPTSVIEVLFLLLLCVVAAKFTKQLEVELALSWLKMPDFVYALFFGVIIANSCELSGRYEINHECVDLLGTLSLSLFLSMALMSLRLWEIFDLALPLIIILLCQTLMIAVFASLVSFRLMGKDYDSSVIAGGHCGFGLGATPTAVMNMSALVSRNGPSPPAFMVVPIVGAFFIDIVNLIVLQTYISFLN